MTVIAHSELKKLLKNGTIKIDPFDESQIGPASIDLHVGNTFLVYKKVRNLFHVVDDADFPHADTFVHPCAIVAART